MHSAAGYGHVAAIKTLAELGGDVNGRHNERFIPMHSAAEEGHVEAIRTLAELGGDVNGMTNVGDSPLKIALRRGNANVVRVLKALSGLGLFCTKFHYLVIRPNHCVRGGCHVFWILLIVLASLVLSQAKPPCLRSLGLPCSAPAIPVLEQSTLL